MKLEDVDENGEFVVYQKNLMDKVNQFLIDGETTDFKFATTIFALKVGFFSMSYCSFSKSIIGLIIYVFISCMHVYVCVFLTRSVYLSILSVYHVSLLFLHGMGYLGLRSLH